MERREFLQKAGLASAATGVVWAAPSVLGASTAFAAGSCAPTVLDWDTAGLTFSNSISKVFGTNTFTIAYSDPSSMVDYTSSYKSGIDNLFPRSPSVLHYHLQLDTSTGSAGTYTTDGSSVTITMTFTSPVTDLAFSLLDVDSQASPAYSGSPLAPSGWVDRVHVEASNGGSPVSGTGTPGASVQTNITDTEFTGANSVDNGQAGADIAFTYPGPVDKVEITYSRAGMVSSQGIGVSDIAFCN